MMLTRARKLLLWCAATDSTFELRTLGERRVLMGKCIHCSRKLTIGLDGTPISEASVEHILPRTHGGRDELDNLAIACKRCNHQKGVRHDHRHKNDEKLQHVIGLLRERRRERRRQPLPGLSLPPFPEDNRGDA